MVAVSLKNDRWIELLAANCARNGIGAVSGRIIGSDGITILSGLVIQTDGSVRDLYKGEGEEVPGFNGRNILAQDIDASSPDCLMVRADLVRRFTAPLSNNLTDRSLLLGKSIYAEGLRIVYLPDITIRGENAGIDAVTNEKYEHARLLYNPNYDPNGALFTLRL